MNEETIKKAVERLKEQMDFVTIHSVPFDKTNTDHLILAAYQLGKGRILDLIATVPEKEQEDE